MVSPIDDASTIEPNRPRPIINISARITDGFLNPIFLHIFFSQHYRLGLYWRLCDVSVTGAWSRIDDSVTAGGLQRGACGMQPSIADENTRQRIIMKYSSSIRQTRQQEMQKCSE